LDGGRLGHRFLLLLLVDGRLGWLGGLGFGGGSLLFLLRLDLLLLGALGLDFVVLKIFFLGLVGRLARSSGDLLGRSGFESRQLLLQRLKVPGDMNLNLGGGERSMLLGQDVQVEGDLRVSGVVQSGDDKALVVLFEEQLGGLPGLAGDSGVGNVEDRRVVVVQSDLFARLKDYSVKHFIVSNQN
jgi:hypothetical protein